MKIIKINSKKHGEHDCLVDDDKYDFLNKWKWGLLVSYNSKYAIRKISKRENGKRHFKCILMHRLILGLTDNSILVDHKDQNGLNNQSYNIRTCTKAQNNRNISSHKNSTSKYLGVCWDSIRGKWKAHITFNKIMYNIGRFEDEKEAALAYNKKAIELFGEFANPNKI